MSWLANNLAPHHVRATGRVLQDARSRSMRLMESRNWYTSHLRQSIRFRWNLCLFIERCVSLPIASTITGD